MQTLKQRKILLLFLSLLTCINLFGVFTVNAAKSPDDADPGQTGKPVTGEESTSTSSGDTTTSSPGKTLSDTLKNQTFKTCEGLPGSVGCGSNGTSSGKDKTLLDFAGTVIATMLKLLASVGVAVAIFGGVRMITSTGNDQGIKKGQAAFVNAIIGIVIVLVSYLVISFVQGIITSSSTNSGGPSPAKSEEKKDSGTPATNTTTAPKATPSTQPGSSPPK